MEKDSSVKEIHPNLLRTYKVLECAFPDGLEPTDYFPLLATLYQEMSDRNLADIVAHFTGKHWAIVYNDVLRAASTDIPYPELVAAMKQRLLNCGADFS